MSLLLVVTACWQIVDIKKGYSYCTTTVSDSFKAIHSVTIDCNYAMFIGPIVVEILLAIGFVCYYLL